jgi:hypothetical protein
MVRNELNNEISPFIAGTEYDQSSNVGQDPRLVEAERRW